MYVQEQARELRRFEEDLEHGKGWERQVKGQVECRGWRAETFGIERYAGHGVLMKRPGYAPLRGLADLLITRERDGKAALVECKSCRGEGNFFHISTSSYSSLLLQVPLGLDVIVVFSQFYWNYVQSLRPVGLGPTEYRGNGSGTPYLAFRRKDQMPPSSFDWYFGSPVEAAMEVA